MSAAGVGIVELGDVCAALRARSLDLFEVTGAWVFDTTDAAQQRWFAEASHRHAWHAELWAGRSPLIPVIDADALVDRHRGRPDAVDVDVEHRADSYRGWLDELLEHLDEVERRIVAELDPATTRAITLTSADLVDLRSR
ncbi:hypothetical protein [Ilumatobacter sp.]|uniref:hypothetical protein n=1 Tax=Ilumatobacter sp. TaxID=1967498 RepID=UPI003AF5C9CE